MIAAVVALALTARVEAVPIPDGPSAVRVNGTVSEAVWQTAPAVDHFVQRQPHDGGEPSQRTEFRVAYDATTLYVKVRAFDTQPDKILSYLTRRDLYSPCDWIHVLVDSYHDRRTAYEFAVNPSGVKLDRYWYSDTRSDDSWDAVWDVTVSRDGAGWTAEFRIPFSQLRFTRSASATFGLAVTRDIGRLNETSTWPLLSRSATGYVSSFGELEGISMAASSKRLELMPYSVSDVTRQDPAGNPLLKPSDPHQTFGLDAKYALTPGLTLTSTINPDFGQVEADPAVVNLTAFETFFTERRPFFVEGSGTFSFPLDCNDGACSGLFYSRRIGRSPQGTDVLPTDDGVYTDVPAQTAILGAAKLTGRVGRYAVGVLEAVTDEQQARVADGFHDYTQPVQPRSSYTVARLRREFDNQSSLGFMATSMNRAAAAGLDFLPNHANAVGADWDVRLRKNFAVTGYLAGSDVTGDPSAITYLAEDSRHYFQRPDTTTLKLDAGATTLTGAAGQIALQKIGGEHVRFNFNTGFKSPGFDINAVGYLRRADQRTMNNWLQIRSDAPNRWSQWRMVNFNQGAAWNYDGDRTSSWQNVNAHVLWANNWQTGVGRNWNQPTIDDRVTRGGPGVRFEGFAGWWYYVNGDSRRRVFVNYFGSQGYDGLGSRWHEYGPEVTYRPVPAIMLTAGLNVNQTVQQSQWVDTVTGTKNHYVFAHMDQTTVSMTWRFNYTVTPTLSLQLYAQPFVSAGDYTAFKEVADPRTVDYPRRYAPYAYDAVANGDPDFNVKSLRTTNVLRWEYKPGSALFVVWQQARENDAVPGGFAFGRDVRGIFDVAPRNVFLVKLSYWFNY